MLRYLMLCLVALGVFPPPALAVYDATSGQWLTRDPAKYVDGPNLYRYGASAPIGNVDAIGLRASPPLLSVKSSAVRTSVPAPDPQVMADCDPDPLVTCAFDLRVQAALQRYYADCANSARRPSLRIHCTQPGLNAFSCLANVIQYGGTGCGDLAHEILHAADACRLNDDCLATINPGPVPVHERCALAMCREARSVSQASCCDPFNPDRIHRTWAECVQAYKPRYLEAYPRLGCDDVRRLFKDAI